MRTAVSCDEMDSEARCQNDDAAEVKVAPKVEKAGNGGSSKKPAAAAKGLGTGAWEIVVAVLIVAGGYCMMQKQSADGMVASCAQLHERGEYEQALSLCSEALAAYHTLNEYTKILGYTDGLMWGDVAQTTDNLGVVTMNLGDTDSSLRYLEKALAMRSVKLGPDSLDVAATKDNLGLVYRQLNQLEKAAQFHNEALDIRLRVVGPNDLGTAATRTAIANVKYQSEEFESALELYAEVLSVQEGILGRDHMDVAATLQNMGQVLKHKDLEGSLEVYQRSLAIIVGIYGHNHRSVADTLNQVGVVLLGLKREEEALATYQEALDISVSILGSGHPDVATALTYIGAVHERSGQGDAAADYYKQSAEIWDGMGLDWEEQLDLTRMESAKEWAVLAKMEKLPPSQA